MEKRTTSLKAATAQSHKNLLSQTRVRFFALLLIGYFGGYVYLRYSKTFVRVENKGEAHRNLILARYDPWDDVAWEMTKEASKKLPLLWPIGAYKRVEKPVLNVLYWPLRRVESCYWTATGQ